MILLVDLCDRNHPLSRDEFVLPLARIIESCDIVPTIQHHTSLTKEDRDAADGVILCGTALKDNEFILHPREFAWLREERMPTLGICAGMQLMVAIFGGHIDPGGEIGMTTIHSLCPDPLLEGKHEFSAYELHSFSPVPPNSFQVLAASSHHPQVIRHRSLPLYGVLFHPEVRNEWVVERFLALCGEEMD
jgi:GMP synthase-like glutamine amidotransferase